MADKIKLTDDQRSILTAIAGNRSSSTVLVTRAKVILEAGDGADDQQIMRKLHLERKTVMDVCKAWNEESSELNAAQRVGREHLRRRIEAVLIDVGKSSVSSGCCGCEDEDDDKRSLGGDLTEQDVQQLAARVYDLLRYELRIEREREAWRG